MQSSQSSCETSSDECYDAAKLLPLNTNSKSFLIFLARVLTRLQFKTRANLDLKTQENKFIKSDLRNAIKRYEYLSLSLNKEITTLKTSLKEMTTKAAERGSKIEFLENRNSQMSNKLNEITREYAFMKEAEDYEKEMQLEIERRNDLRKIFKEASLTAHILNLERNIKKNNLVTVTTTEILPEPASKALSAQPRHKSETDLGVCAPPPLASAKSLAALSANTGSPSANTGSLSAQMLLQPPTMKVNSKVESMAILKRQLRRAPAPALFDTFMASSTKSLEALDRCPAEEIARNLMLLLYSVKETPLWLNWAKERVNSALLLRSVESPFLRQNIYYAASSGIVSTKDLELPVLPDSLRVYDAFFSKKRRKGFKVVVSEGTSVYHPFEAWPVARIEVKRVIGSNTRPLLVKVYEKESTKEKGRASLVILKSGDDLRRDMAVMQIFRMLNSLWRAEPSVEQLGAVEAVTYDVVAIGPSIGIIQYILKSFPIQELRRHQKKFGPQERQRQINTAAGGTMASFFLGIKDRHDDNTLFCDNGDIFQIDFSYMMGEKVTVDTAEISITRDTKRHFGDSGWRSFVEACVRAYCTIRNNNELVIAYAKMILSELYSPYRVQNYIEQTLMLDTPYEAAVKQLRLLLKKAPSSYRTRFKNVLHHTALAFSKKAATETKLSLSQTLENEGAAE